MSTKGTTTSTRCISCFEDNLKRFAVVTKDNKINVWDSSAGSLRGQCFSAATTTKQTNQYTSIAWGKSGVKTPKGDRGGANDIVVGTINGAIHVWDLLTSEIALSLGEKGEGHVGTVMDVMFHHQGGASSIVLFSSGSDGEVIQWDLKNKSVALKWKASATGVTKIAVHTSKEVGGLLATASAEAGGIKVWDRASQKIRVKFNATQQGDVDQLVFTPDGQYLLSNGTQRIINMWSTTTSTTTTTSQSQSQSQSQATATKEIKSALRAFSCDSVPLALKVTQKKASSKNNNTYLFLAITEGGVLNVFDSSVVNSGITPPSCLVRLEPPQKSTKPNDKEVSSFGQYFVAANFYDNKDLLVVVGPETSPSFQRISFANEDGTLIKSISVEHKPPTTTSADRHSILVKQAKGGSTMTLEASTIPPPNLGAGEGEGEVADGTKKRKAEVSIASVDAKKMATIENAAKEANSDITFQAALEQAIHTNDKHLLYRLLGISKYEMIKHTLQKLAPSFIIPLVKLMINILQSPGHPQSLYSYLHIIVNNHTSLLMSSGALRDCSALYSAINARAASYLDLLKAKGRLDLFLAHLDQAQASVVVDTNAKNTYRESSLSAVNEDEDEEADESGSEGEGEEKGEDEGGESDNDKGKEEEFININGDKDDSENEDNDKDEDNTTNSKQRQNNNENNESNEDDDDEDEDEDRDGDDDKE